MCDNSIKKCDANIRKELYRITALAGVSTMFPGWDSLLENVVDNHRLFYSDMVITHLEGSLLAWKGGSIQLHRRRSRTCWSRNGSSTSLVDGLFSKSVQIQSRFFQRTLSVVVKLNGHV